MTILTKIQLVFNIMNNKILEGEKEIPKWHHLYGKRCWRCGTYLRSLILYDGRIVQYRIYRYYSPEEKKTYSLLPFFIQRYERHINTVIQSVLEHHFVVGIGNEAKDEFSKQEVPSEWTERRWIKKFKSKFNELESNFEEFLCRYYPEHLPASENAVSIGQKMQHMFDKTKIMINGKIDKILQYGELSFCLLAQSIENPTARCFGR